MFSILLLFIKAQIQIRCELKQLYENFNSLQIENVIGWSCVNLQNPEVYTCQNGMDLIKVDKNCQEIQHQIKDILPHFQVQIYIDIYCYGELDENDNVVILIDQTQFWQTQNTFLPVQIQPLGKSHQCRSYDDTINYQIRQTVVQDLSHNLENLNLVLRSTLSQDFNSETYLFRNLQIFYNPCFKTCKTCSSDKLNQCTSCYPNIPLISGTCSSCKWNINQTFLLIPQGCVVQCPEEYSYDEDKVCYRNQKLITYRQSQLIKIKESYQISGNLESSAVLLRLTLKVELHGNNHVDLLINGKKIATISQTHISTKLKYNYLQAMQSQIIEFDAPINSGSFIIKIDGFKKRDVFNIVPEVKVQYLVCALNCQQCKNDENCKICQPDYYLYFGECLTTCPQYTTVSNKSCIDLQEITYDENLEEVFLVKEFYDLSTTQKRINELFTLLETNNSIYNFQKGNEIYFSYFDNRRIFGGPFVWINAKFNFHLELEKISQNIYIQFDVILGDEEMNRISFHYTINSEVEKTLVINTNKNLKLDQNWQDSYCIDVISVRETIEYPNNTNNQLNILFYCDNSFINANTTFCGIQNLFVTIQHQKQGQSDLSEEEQIDDQDLETTFEISICGDEKVSEDEECDDGNLIPFDGCFNCQYQCEYLCQFCVKGECLFNFEQQSFLQSVPNISMGLEEKQLLFCHAYCEICVQGNCLQCQIGYYMNIINNVCESKCGDIIISGNEQCDDGNLDNYDGCSDCQLVDYENCVILQTCAVCYYDTCLKCIDGYTLENNKCISICGDGLINNLEEQCDNPNEKGCINCQIQSGYVCQGISYSVCRTCGNYCTACSVINQQNLLCKDCIIGYYPVLDSCLECDKNCISCKVQSNLCTSCYRSDCELCESVSGYYTDFQNKRCFAKCGDGILVEEEECDDGNIENADGCDSQCKIEFAQNQLNDLLVWHFNGNTIYDFSLMSSEYKLELSCQDPLIIIDGMDTKDFFFNISVINNICRVEFKFQKSIFKYNTIHVELSLSFTENRLLIQNNNMRVIQFDIQPNEQILLSEDEKMQANQIANVQQSFSFLFVVIIPVSIVTNLYDYLWAVLEILSWVNNFYFLNVRYPFNVEMFLLNSDWSAFVVLPTYQGLNQPNCSYYFSAPQKFQNKGIDPLFFNNIQIPFIFIISIFLIYEFNFILLFLLKALSPSENKKIYLTHKHFSIFCLQAKRKTQLTQVQQQQQDRRRTQQTQVQQQQSDNKRTESTQVQQQQDQKKIQINSILKRVVGYLIIIDKKLKNKLKQTLSLCLLDITLAIMLQITFSNNNSSAIVGLNQFFAVISINILLFQLYKSYQTLNIHILLAENKQYKEEFEIYYENVNKKESFGYYFKFFGLIRKILYIFFMVHYYYYPIFQTLFCFVSTSIGVVFILYQNPYDTKREFYTQFISEFSLSIILLIAVLFSINDTQQIMFIERNKVIFGWSVISCVILAILVQICGLIYGLMIHICQILLKIKNYFQKNYTNNHQRKKQLDNLNNDLSQLQGQIKFDQFDNIQMKEKEQSKKHIEQQKIIEL